MDQRAGLDEQIFRHQLSVQCSKQSLPHLSRDRRQTEAAASGVSSSRENSRNRRNDKRSDIASSKLSSDSAYQRCSNSAFSMASGGYDGRPHAPDRTGMTNAASGCPVDHLIDALEWPVDPYLRRHKRVDKALH